MIDDLFSFIDNSIEPMEEELFPFVGHINPCFGYAKNSEPLPLDWQIGLTLIGERGREQLYERMRLMRIKHRIE